MLLGTGPSTFDGDPTVLSAPAAPLLLRSAVSGGAEFTEILPPTQCADKVAAMLRY